MFKLIMNSLIKLFVCGKFSNYQIWIILRKKWNGVETNINIPTSIKYKSKSSNKFLKQQISIYPCTVYWEGRVAILIVSVTECSITNQSKYCLLFFPTLSLPVTIMILNTNLSTIIISQILLNIF